MLKHLALIQTVAKATTQTIDTLRNLAVQFRAIQLFAHNAHHDIRGPAFFGDHEFLAEAYAKYDEIYDTIVEHMKALGGNPLLGSLPQDAAVIAGTKPMYGTAEGYMQTLLVWEQGICLTIGAAVKEPAMDEGARNLLCGIADDSLIRQYKLRQRLGGDVAKCDQVGLSLRHPGQPEKTPTYADDQKADAGQDVEYPNNLQKAGKSMTTQLSKAGMTFKEAPVSFGSGLRQFGAFKANISKAGKGWFHGNQVVPGSKSAKAEAYAGKMKEAKAAAKGGSALQAKAAEYEAMNNWRKMAPGERGHAMQLLNDSASEDIGKTVDRGFEFGHNRKNRM